MQVKAKSYICCTHFLHIVTVYNKNCSNMHEPDSPLMISCTGTFLFTTIYIAITALQLMGNLFLRTSLH